MIALHGAVAGGCVKHEGCRHSVNGSIGALAHDVEKARDCQKESLEVASSQDSASEDLRCRSHMTTFRLVRNLAGILLLYPTCMLIMSNYAATRGLLQGSSLNFQVSNDPHEPSNDLLTKFRCRLTFYHNSYSCRLRRCSSLRASSGQCSSIYTTKAMLKTISRR